MADRRYNESLLGNPGRLQYYPLDVRQAEDQGWLTVRNHETNGKYILVLTVLIFKNMLLTAISRTSNQRAGLSSCMACFCSSHGATSDSARLVPREPEAAKMACEKSPRSCTWQR